MTHLKSIPALRVRRCNHAPVNPAGDFVLYWMTASRRTNWNFALERAVGWAQEFSKPLVILEALRCDYPWASDRLHHFILQGMADNAVSCGKAGVFYYPYVEPAPGRGKGLLAALAARACAVVTDDFPCFFLPRMLAAASRGLPIRLEAVDSNGLLPLGASDRIFRTARSFRRFYQVSILDHLSGFPCREPLKKLRPSLSFKPPAAIRRRWPMAPQSLLEGGDLTLARLPIDHSVEPVRTTGGSKAANAELKLFLKRNLAQYAEPCREPRRRDHQRPFSLSAFRPHFRASHLLCPHEAGRVVS